MAASSTNGADLPDTRVLRRHLGSIAARGATATYREVAEALGLQPPQTIHRTAMALEDLMTEDAAAGRPLLAAVVVSRRGKLPAPGFFLHAGALGLHDGTESGPGAAEFHRRQLARVHQEYAGDDTSS